MVTRLHHKKLERIIKRMRGKVIRGQEERVKLETKEEERGSMAEIIRKTVKEEFRRKEAQPSGEENYATVLGRKETPKVPKISGVKGPVQPTPKMVIVSYEEKESDEVVSTLKRLVKPSEIGLKVKRMIKIRKGVLLEAESEEGIVNLMKLQGASRCWNEGWETGEEEASHHGVRCKC